MNAIGLPSFGNTGVADLSQKPDWNKIKKPRQTLSLTAAASKEYHQAVGDRLVAIYGELSPEIGIEHVKCRDHACTSDIQFPPADLINIRGFREVR
jgi:hypothetical protein